MLAQPTGEVGVCVDGAVLLRDTLPCIDPAAFDVGVKFEFGCAWCDDRCAFACTVLHGRNGEARGCRSVNSPRDPRQGLLVRRARDVEWAIAVVVLDGP